MAQVTFVADAETANNTDSSTETIVSKPTGTTDGDLLITFIFTNDGGRSITTLSGWTLLDTLTGGVSDDGKMVAYWKIASSEGASYTWTHGALSTSEVLIAHTSAWRNTHQTAPLAVYSQVADAGSNTTSTGAGVTTDASSNGMLLQVHGAPASANFSGYAVANNNPTWTEIADLTATNSTRSSALGAAYANYDLAQATGDVTATISTSATSLFFIAFIRPAGFAFDTALATLALTTLATTLTIAFPTVATATSVITPYASALAVADPDILNASKNAASFSNTAKNDATAANTAKSSTIWSNTNKS